MNSTTIHQMKSRIKSGLGRSACQDRSEKTRQRLIEVALEVFADLGYEAASTRTIVERAHANLVSIPYYFGSKLGLYHAVAEYISSHLAEAFHPACERARAQLLQLEQSHEQMLENFKEFMAEFARLMLGTQAPSSWGVFIYREQFDPTEAFEIIHANFAPLLELGCEYVGRLTNRPADAPETRIQFLSIMAMVKFIRVDRASVLRVMEWRNFGEAETKVVTDMLRQNLQALFGRSA
jgi:AcrR family transcriptional regulator